MMKTIHTNDAPAAVGPYSQAIQAGNTLYLSGQIAINPAEGKIVAATIEEQAEQCCRNIEAVLAAAGLRPAFCQQTGPQLCGGKGSAGGGAL